MPASQEGQAGFYQPRVAPEASSDMYLDWSARARNAADTLVCAGSSSLVQRNQHGSNGRGPHHSPSLRPHSSHALWHSPAYNEAGCRPWTAPLRALSLRPQCAQALRNSTGFHEAGCGPWLTTFRALSMRASDLPAGRPMHPIRLWQPRPRPWLSSSVAQVHGCSLHAGMAAANVCTSGRLVHGPPCLKPFRPWRPTFMSMPTRNASVRHLTQCAARML